MKLKHLLGSLMVATLSFSAIEATAAPSVSIDTESASRVNMQGGLSGNDLLISSVGEIYPAPGVIVGNEPGSRVNVRSGPSTQYGIQHHGLVGDEITILEALGVDVSNSIWWFKVRFPKTGATGWVHGDFIEHY